MPAFHHKSNNNGCSSSRTTKFQGVRHKQLLPVRIRHNQVLPVRRVHKKIYPPTKRREEEEILFNNTVMANKDTMENAWGVDLVDSAGRRDGCGTREELNRSIKSSIVGFQLLKLTNCGSDANQIAIDKATGRNISRLLIACGSYVGGGDVLLTYSSSKVLPTKHLSLPMYPNDVTHDDCLNQTVPLPYHIRGSEKISQQEIWNIEQQCLKAIHKKILVAEFMGCPYKVLLLELVLGGSGAELSSSFMESLGYLLKHFGIVVIVDEILTMGRCGPTMVVTSTIPTSLKSQVAFITAGKVTHCGMVLERSPEKPRELCSGYRGQSTDMPPAKACQQWRLVAERVKFGIPLERQQTVLKQLRLPSTEDYWGKGCLLFTSKYRPGVLKGLQCRLLPKLEQTKLAIGTTKNSNWNRSLLTTELFKIERQWVKHIHSNLQSTAPFYSALYDYIDSLREPTGLFLDSQLLDFIEKNGDDNAFDRERERISAIISTNKCKTKALTFVQQTTRFASKNTKSRYDPVQAEKIPSLSKKRKGNKRLAMTYYNKLCLGFQCW